MPRIDYQPKLDFNQVLITPKRSNLNSRSQVILERTFTFKNGQTWTGVPIICANTPPLSMSVTKIQFAFKYFATLKLVRSL